MTVLIGLIFATLACLCTAKELPSYLKVCKRNDPNLSECFRDAVQDALPKIKNGIPEFNLSPIEPLEIVSLSIGAGESAVKVVQNYKNLKVRGISEAIVNSATLEHLEGGDFRATMDTTIPLTTAEGEYSIDGQILMLPIAGSGTFGIIFKDARVLVTLIGAKMEKKGKIYIKLTDVKVDFSPKDAKFTFDNLFNGDERLGESMNKLMNDNWKSLFDDIKEGFDETFSALFKNTANKIFTSVPVDDIFPM